MKKKLIEEYFHSQKKEKSQIIETKYQYWDGSHKGSSLKIQKGTTIGEFISIALIHLSKIYKRLEGAPIEGFMYVKGDYIIPPVRQLFWNTI